MNQVTAAFWGTLGFFGIFLKKPENNPATVRKARVHAGFTQKKF
jgi:hypothetical protein